MASVADIIQITQCSEIAGQQACNVFYYVVAVWTGNMTVEEVLQYWLDEHWTQLAAEMAPAVTGDFIEWRNLDNTSEVVNIPNSANGLNLGASMGPFVAISARLYGETSETRSGWKRFPGALEEGQENGELNGATKTAWQTKVNVLMADVNAEEGAGIEATLIPVIVGRALDGTLDLTRTQPVVNALVQPRITTQNTRKVGRGS